MKGVILTFNKMAQGLGLDGVAVLMDKDIELGRWAGGGNQIDSNGPSHEIDFW